MMSRRPAITGGRGDEVQTALDIECDSCGHMISLYHEMQPDRLELLGNRVADVVGSLWFIASLVLASITWIALNVIFRPFMPYPMVMIGGLGMGLSLLSATYGPLILLAQRHTAARDRARDIETFRISANNERDLHSVIALLNDGDGGPPPP